MPRYKVELISIDRKDESRNVHFSTIVDANDRADAIEKVKAIQKTKRPDINVADTWADVVYETAEQ